MRALPGFFPLALAVGLATQCEAQVPVDEQDQRARSLLGDDYQSLSAMLRTPPGQLSRAIVTWESKQQSYLKLLKATLRATPRNREEVIIATASAKLLSNYTNADALKTFLAEIDYDGTRFLEGDLRSSLGRSLGPMSDRFPCVLALVRVGESKAEEIIKYTLTSTDRSSLQIELTAYSLLQIESNKGRDGMGTLLILPEWRGNLVHTARAVHRENGDTGEHAKRRLDLLVNYLLDVEPLYYRSTGAGKEASYTPPAYSALFSDGYGPTLERSKEGHEAND